MAQNRAARRRRRVVLLVLAALVVVVVGILWTQRSRAAATKSVAQEDLDVRLGKSEVQDIQVVVSEVGTIEPVVKVDVKSTLSGKVTELLVREGDRVTRGQILARVEPDVNQAQTLSNVRTELNLAEIRAGDAQKDLDRNARLREEGYISDQDLKQYRFKVDTTREDLEAAKTRMRIVEESGVPLEAKITASSRANLVSPMDGVVIKKNVEVGQTVMSGLSSFNEGTVIYTVADVGSMLIKATVNEVDVGRVRLAMPVTITVDAFPYRRFEGRVSHISPAARLKDKVKVFDVEVTLGRQEADFRAGMTANIEVKGDRVEKVLAVPVESIFKREGREVVYELKGTFDAAAAGAKPLPKAKSGRLDVSGDWKRFFVERTVKVGLVGLERAELREGLGKGVQVALEDPTRARVVSEDD